jgi:hypothetical protein
MVQVYSLKGMGVMMRYGRGVGEDEAAYVVY